MTEEERLRARYEKTYEVLERVKQENERLKHRCKELYGVGVRALAIIEQLPQGGAVGTLKRQLDQELGAHALDFGQSSPESGARP